MKKTWEIIVFILKVTFFSFGGGQIATPIIYRIAVKEKKWINKKEFEKIIITTNLLPGPGLVQTLAFIAIKRLGKILGIIVSVLALFPHIMLVSIIYIILKNQVGPKGDQYLTIISIAVTPIISALLLGTAIKFTKESYLVIGLPWTIFLTIVSCYFYLLVPSPFNLPAIIIISVTILIILLTFILNRQKNKYKKVKVKNA
ncbi:MAG: chromate transporter [Mycoplasma sp.]|nr:chromate transporter [Mycoplasma sp.]